MFLAVVLVIGIIALSSPSFMVGAQGEPYYGMENNHKKSYGKDVRVNPIKCNNINVNLNGFNGIELNTLPTSLNVLATDEGEVGASSSGSGSGSDGSRPSGSDSDSRFVCINNNNFVSDGGTTPESPPPPCKVTVDTITGLGSSPVGIAHDPDHQRMYVTNQDDGTVSVIDTSTNTVDPTTITVGSIPLFIAHDPDNHRMYVTNAGDVLSL